MELFSIQELIVAVKFFMKTNSTTAVQHDFHSASLLTHYGNMNWPSRSSHISAEIFSVKLLEKQSI
jgi:hypothetical protein